MAKEKKKLKESREIPEGKLKTVSEIENLIKKSKTFMICSIKSLPGKQYQAIKKKIRDIAKVKVIKKSLALRAIDNSGIEIKKLKDYVKEDSALLFSELDAFELAGMLSENKTPVGAKVGQIANEDIIVEPGPTDLVPGPVISELGALGLKIAIEDGKINIKEKKVIVKKGGAVNEAAAGLMSKLDIKPFSIGFEPVAAYDNQEKKVYAGIRINREETLEDLKRSHSKALGFAVNIAYVCRETLKFILGKAAGQEKAILNLVNKPQESQSPSTEKVEEIKS
jgi:large subunit ribosomal protein L10